MFTDVRFATEDEAERVNKDIGKCHSFHYSCSICFSKSCGMVIKRINLPNLNFRFIILTNLLLNGIFIKMPTGI